MSSQLAFDFPEEGVVLRVLAICDGLRFYWPYWAPVGRAWSCNFNDVEPSTSEQWEQGTLFS